MGYGKGTVSVGRWKQKGVTQIIDRMARQTLLLHATCRGFVYAQ